MTIACSVSLLLRITYTFVHYDYSLCLLRVSSPKSIFLCQFHMSLLLENQLYKISNQQVISQQQTVQQRE